jgi:hypothetical protein
MNKSIIFIVGAGHSGSTLLAKALNAHSKIFALSEIDNFYNDIHINNDAHCGCNVLLRECPFWEDINQKLKEVLNFGIKDHPNLFRMSKTEGRDRIFNRITFRMSRIAAYVFGLHSKHIQTRMYNIKVLFDLIIDKTKTPYLVDSSKSAKRAYLLKHYFKNYGYDVKVIHLVRDGRAVLYSYLKGYYKVKLKNPKTGEYEMKTFYSDRKHKPKDVISAWKKNNFIAELLHKRLSRDSYILLRYEDYANSPETVLRQLISLLGLEYEDAMIDLNRYDNHMVAGNASRINATRIHKPINNWIELLKEEDKTYFNRKAGWLNKKYGYR